MPIVCCPLSGSDNGAAAGRTEIRKARVFHRCCECDSDIHPGGHYEYQTGCWGGSWDCYKTCMGCVEIRDHFACDGYVFGQLWSDLRENFLPTMKAGGPCLEGLSAAAKSRLFEKALAQRLGSD